MLTVITLSLALLAGGAPAAPASTQAVAMEAPVALPMSIGDIGSLAFCSASATCGDKDNVRCEDNTDPAECTAVDTDCSTSPVTIGYVECDGVRTSCPDDSCDCSDICCEGETRQIKTPFCCSSYPRGEIGYQEEECVDGQWVFKRTFCLPDPSCGF